MTETTSFRIIVIDGRIELHAITGPYESPAQRVVPCGMDAVTALRLAEDLKSASLLLSRNRETLAIAQCHPGIPLDQP